MRGTPTWQHLCIKNTARDENNKNKEEDAKKEEGRRNHTSRVAQRSHKRQPERTVFMSAQNNIRREREIRLHIRGKQGVISN